MSYLLLDLIVCHRFSKSISFNGTVMYIYWYNLQKEVTVLVSV